MPHPDMVVRKSRINGRGLFAKKFIPRGTLLWCLSKNDRIYTEEQYKKLSKIYRKRIDKYVYFSEGKLILLKDNARFWNHSCNPNASHCWDIEFDIALRDIRKNEEITYDYTLLLDPGEKLTCNCGLTNCRKVIRKETKSVINKLNERANMARKEIGDVPQLLLKKLAQPNGFGELS